MKLKLKETLAKILKIIKPATCTAVSFPFTPPCNGLLIGLIRAGAQGRCYALLTNAEPNIIDCYQTSGGYCVGAVFVTKNRKVDQNGSSNLESAVYYFIPLVGGVLRNPVISRLTSIFTSLLFGGDVDEAVIETTAKEVDTRTNKDTKECVRLCGVHRSENGYADRRWNGQQSAGHKRWENSSILHADTVSITISERRWAA